MEIMTYNLDLLKFYKNSNLPSSRKYKDKKNNSLHPAIHQALCYCCMEFNLCIKSHKTFYYYWIM